MTSEGLAVQRCRWRPVQQLEYVYPVNEAGSE
jgi:hypothetical protein